MEEKEEKKEKKEKNETAKTHHDNREKNFSVSFTAEEYELFKKNVKQSGMKKTDYARMMLTQGQVIQRLDDEDRKQINQLSKIGKDLHRLLGAAYKEGLEKHVKWLGKIELDYKNNFENIKKIME